MCAKEMMVKSKLVEQLERKHARIKLNAVSRVLVTWFGVASKQVAGRHVS